MAITEMAPLVAEDGSGVSVVPNEHVLEMAEQVIERALLAPPLVELTREVEKHEQYLGQRPHDVKALNEGLRSRLPEGAVIHLIEEPYIQRILRASDDREIDRALAVPFLYTLPNEPIAAHQGVHEITYDPATRVIPDDIITQLGAVANDRFKNGIGHTRWIVGM